MKTTSKTLIAACAAFALVCGGFSHQAVAVPIQGQITMAGQANLNNVNLGSATAVTSFGQVIVIGPTSGSYAGTQGSNVAWTPFSWNPSSAPVSPLWTFMSGGLTYSFNLASLAVNFQSNTFLNISGIGTLTITGGMSNFDPTTGAWSFSIANPGGNPQADFQFGFVSSNEAIPEGGSALALLGVALVGVEFLRRKLAAA